MDYSVICNAAPGATAAVEADGTFTMATSATQTTSEIVEGLNAGATQNVATNAAWNIYIFPAFVTNTVNDSATVRQFVVEAH